MASISADAYMQGPLMGTLLTMGLYGMNCMQLHYYAQNYSKDPLGLRVLVAVVWILETVETGLSIFFVEHYLIQNFADPYELTQIVWSMPATFVIGFTVAFIVNLCFIWRVWRLCNNLWNPITLLVLALGRLVLGWANFFLALGATSWDDFRKDAYLPVLVSWFLSIAVDALIALVLCYYLYTKRTGMRRTDNIVSRLVLYTISTGAMTSLGAVLVLVTFLAVPTSLAFLGILEIQVKLYSVSLMASFNSRNSTLARSRMLIATVDNVPLSSMHFPAPESPIGASESTTKIMRIPIRKTDDERKANRGILPQRTEDVPV